MGRKPNPLIVEFFERGSKIGDASNRYEHTCKKCGEQFPKGRIDSLTAHLTKKCVALSTTERTKLVLRLHDLADPSVDSNMEPAADGTKAAKGGSVNRPFTPNRQHNFNALNVLAEASRRVGGNAQYSGYAPAAPVESQAQLQAQAAQAQAQIHHDHNGGLPLDPQLEAQLDVDNFTDHFLDDHSIGRNGFQTTTAPHLPSLYPFLHTGPPVTQDDLAGLPLVSTHPPDLSTIAASANETLANGLMDTDLDMSRDEDTSVLLEGLQEHAFPAGRPAFSWQPMGPPLLAAQPISNMMPPTMGNPTPQLRPIAMNPVRGPTHFVVESGTLAKAQKPKVRGRFAPERRKEVRELRKVGACMRCRILKKVCSQETPCQTCAAIESPRLWKHACVRTKLADEFPLYFVCLYGIMIYEENKKMKTNFVLESYEGTIEASHFGDQSIIFNGLKCNPRRQPPNAAGEPGFIVIDLESENVLPKIERYLPAISSQLIGQEISTVMRTSLEMAQSFKNGQQNNPTIEKQDNLISEIIELWAATAMLTDPDLKPLFVTVLTLTGERSVITQDSSPYANATMTLQYRAAVEKRASVLCRSIMHHFEQRVLSRQKSTHFETFLGAFILLGCAERMCWLYRCWEDENSRAYVWTLDAQPGVYADKGERFAQMVQMLLNLRQLEPKIVFDSNSGLIIPRDNKDPDLALWLVSAGMTRGFAMRRETAVFDPNDCRSLEGSLSGHLLQV